MTSEFFHRTALIVAIVASLAGCAGPRALMPTPNVHLDKTRDFYGDLGQPLKSRQVRLFYGTDRAPETDESGALRYGTQRSNSMAFGTAVVDLGDDITWGELVQASRTDKRLEPVHLQVTEIKELLRAPPTPLPFKTVDGQIVEEEASVRQRRAFNEEFRRILGQHLAVTPRKEVFLYVHGYHNTFDDAAFAMAELWHFLGRIGVPIVYTWPAGYPGLFGYTYDRESSEFTVYHMRRALKGIASVPEVERINIIAHSRGTDVAVNALRELTIEARAKGLDPKVEYKLHNLVLAAPDLDLQVAVQRILGDKLAESVDRFTVYTSPADRAIGISSTLFASPRGRVGTFGADDAQGLVKSAMEYGNANLAIVNFSGTGDAASDTYGHSYFRDSPTVSSDVVIMLRDDLDPGDPGRPLEPIGKKFWRVPPGYPATR